MPFKKGNKSKTQFKRNGIPWNKGVSKHPPSYKYYQAQKDNAKRRGIAFELSFEQWWSIWESSGFWEQRGRGRGLYCMGRIGDKGTYRVGNVKIITHETNSGEKPWTLKRRKKHALALRGNKNKLGKKESKQTRRLKSKIVTQRWKEGGYVKVDFRGRWDSPRRRRQSKD